MTDASVEHQSIGRNVANQPPPHRPRRDSLYWFLSVGFIVRTRERKGATPQGEGRIVLASIGLTCSRASAV